MRHSGLIGILGVIGLVITGCSTSPSGVGSCGTISTLGGTMSAIVDGKSWSTASVLAKLNGNSFSVAGSDGCFPKTTIGFAVQGTAGNTYTVDVGVLTASGLNATLLLDPASLWVANITGGHGKVKLDTFDATGASGSFEFTQMTASPGTGATGDKVVTSGVFNVKF